MKTFDGKEITKSWAVMDDNGEEYISAVTILFSAAGDVARAKRIARSDVNSVGQQCGKIKKWAKISDN